MFVNRYNMFLKPISTDNLVGVTTANGEAVNTGKNFGL